jgi:Reverse transcriptase (RNA-dependent DNA polymerase)
MVMAPTRSDDRGRDAVADLGVAESSDAEEPFRLRVATQLAPLDSLIFSALVYDIAKDLERYRYPTATGRVFSHRVKREPGTGQLYDPRWNFDAFKVYMRTKCNQYEGGWLIATDVADFYSRIYHHPLENTLRSATPRTEHVDGIMRLLSQWNFTVSSGLPIGPAASRILAEMALVDVDQVLIDADIDFCRFSDDYRLFARTEREAHESLAVLATALGESHLTLSERKTDILPTYRYLARYIEGERPDDAASLAGRIAQILEKYGYENDVYSEAELEQLPPEMVRELDELDLNNILREKSAESRFYDVFIVSLALRRLAQLRDDALSSLVAANLHQFTPVLPQTMNYFAASLPRVRVRTWAMTCWTGYPVALRDTENMSWLGFWICSCPIRIGHKHRSCKHLSPKRLALLFGRR